MKTFSVIVILSTLSLSHSLDCKQVTDWSTKVTYEAASQTCTGDDKCVRPVWDGAAYKAAADGGKWGCGKCDPKKSCVECATDNCNVEPVFKCKTDASGTDSAKACPETVATTDAYSTLATKCYRPKMVDMDGTYATDGATWGCAACAKPENCAECTSSLCNVAPTATHKCLTYTKTTTYAKGPEHACPDDLTGCKMPTPDNTAAKWDPCGPCADSNDKTCQACNSGDNCNDIAAATVRYCKAGKADAALNSLVSNFCDANSDCKRPYVSAGEIVTDASDYACGDCDAAKKDKTCKNCATKSNDCNGAWPPKAKCFKWTWNTDKYTTSGAAEECASDDHTAKCSRPVFVAKEAGFKDLTGCGPCPAGSKDCKDFGAEQNVAGSHECFLWDWNETDKKWKTSELQAQCDSSSDKKCSLPINRSTKEGFTSTGCGSCKAEEAKGCTTTDPGKNVAGSHQCYQWTWNDADKKWESSETLGECNSPSDKKCNLPKDRSAKDGFTSSGCGSCKSAEAAACMTTDEGKNWGQRVTISLLAAVLPLLYVML